MVDLSTSLPNKVDKALTKVFRRWAKAARTTWKNSVSSGTSTGGLPRTIMRMTEDVTFGAGRKQEGGTSYSRSQSA